MLYTDTIRNNSSGLNLINRSFLPSARKTSIHPKERHPTHPQIPEEIMNFTSVKVIRSLLITKIILIQSCLRLQRNEMGFSIYYRFDKYLLSEGKIRITKTPWTESARSQRQRRDLLILWNEIGLMFLSVLPVF